MVSIPVRLFPATQDKDVSFHLLHQPDHSRIKFKRFCAAEDEEVPQEELVKAFEVSRDQYVEITDEDLEQLPLPAKHTIELSAFVNAREIDPIYYEKSYYLEPEESGVKPYALLSKVLDEKQVAGVASIAIRNKESLCALRPLDGTLLLETLHYPDEIRAREFEGSDVKVSDRELSVAGSLVDALAEKFQPDKYHDHYREALLELIKNKTEGREVVAPEEAGPTPKVGDLMEALRASIAAAKQRKGGSAEPVPAAPREEADQPAAARSRKTAAAQSGERKPARSRKRAA